MIEAVTATGVVVAASAIAAVVKELYDAAKMLQAKHRAQVIVKDLAASDDELKEFARQVYEVRLSPLELKEAIHRIEATTAALSMEDKKVLQQGLNQASLRGANNFIADVLSPARAA